MKPEPSQDQPLPSASSVRRLAVSETGFVFDPATGRSFTVNETGATIIKALQQDQSLEAIRRQLAAEYDVSAQPLERDITEFLASLREQLA